jgi:hypothetical protein
VQKFRQKIAKNGQIQGQKIKSAALISLIFHSNQNNKYNEKNPFIPNSNRVCLWIFDVY